MPDPEVVWLVLARGLGETITVAGQGEQIAVLVLDADSGLVRGIGLAPTVQQAAGDAAHAALTRPAGPLPAQIPATIVYDDGPYATLLAQALRDALPAGAPTR